ncbi:translation initiation factor eIF2 assembly protein-like isoform X1 [Styela clava]
MTTLTKEHVMNCMFSKWYSQFSDITIKSFIIPLPDDFVEYLQKDGPLILPKGADLSIQSNFDDNENWSDEDETQNENEAPQFTALLEQIKEVLEKLNWKSFPKLNWSSPKDAIWITSNNSLKCNTPGDIILLMKSSDFITYDLTSPFKLCTDDSIPDPQFQKELVLRKWANLVPGMEFRCFVRNHKLIAACQRHHQQYYEYVESQQQSLPVEICRFFQEKIQHKFNNSNYVVDIYKKRDGKFWIIDFNPWGSMTDSLLFTWEELNSFVQSQLTEEDCPIITPDGEPIGMFRFAKRDATMQPSETLSYRMPQDFLDLSRGEDATKLVDFLRMKIQNENDDSSSDDDEPWQLPASNSNT